jgi:hypothetical protein
MAQVGSGFHKGGTVRVEGISALNRKLSRAGADAGDMRELMHSLGEIVIAHANVPRNSGALANTLRAGKGKTKAVVRAGYSKRSPYAGVVHYGNPYRGTRAQPFLTDALKASRGRVLAALESGIDNILKKNNLN